MTFDPAEGKQKPEAYMEGVTPLDDYHHNGVSGYVSMVGIWIPPICAGKVMESI